MNKEEIDDLCDKNDYINGKRTNRDYYYYTNGYQNCLNAEVIPLKQELTKSNNKIEKIKDICSNIREHGDYVELRDIKEDILSIIDGSDE